MSQTAERPGEKTLPRPVIVLIACLVAVAVALWRVWPPWHLDGELVGAVALAALALIAQLTPIDLYGAGRVSTSGILILAAGMLQGVPGALLLATLVALLQWGVSRGRLHRLLFDLGMLNAAGAAGALVYLGISPLVSTEVSPWIAPIGVVAGLGFYLVNIGLLALVMGLSEHRRPLAVWEERFRWLWLHYLVYGLLAAFIVLAYRAIGILGLAVFFVPPTMLRYVMRQYVARTEQSVVKLTAANQELVQAHDETSRALAQLQRNYEATLLTLSVALDSRDAETEGHSRRVVEYAKLIGAVLRLSDEQLADLVLRWPLTRRRQDRCARPHPPKAGAAGPSGVGTDAGPL